MIRKNLLMIVVILLSGMAAMSQKTSTLPLNERVSTGTLSNGMTYYIMHNQEPEGRVDFYFAQNVGAILEEDSQNGLAHFLEHMAFNGLEHFPGKTMLNYLESKGIKFGRDINAFTSRDETVYNINNVQTEDENLIDSVLLVLHDWSGGLLLQAEEIEAERGVIHEEWRTRRNSRFRLMTQTNPVLYNHSQYAKRDVIGSLDVIDNFEHQELRDYYKKWYRPDQQAVIVVGDIDVEVMEKKIIDLFSQIPMPENAAERVYYEIEPSTELGFKVATDKEAQMPILTWYFRNEASMEVNEETFRQQFIGYFFSLLFNTRLNELKQDPSCPALYMQAMKFSMTRSMDVSMIMAVAKNDQERESFELIMSELEKVRRFGFTESELERVKSEISTMYEDYEKTYEETNSSDWARKLYSHFLKAEDVLPLEFELAFVKNVLETVTLDEIQAFLKNFDNVNNSVITITGPEKEGYPTKEELLDIVAKVKKANIEAYEDLVDDSPLVKEELQEKTIVNTEEVEGVDAKEYTFENGAKVIVYPTDHAKNEILLSAYSPGGQSLVKTEDLESANVATSLATSSGLGEHDNIQLQKKLAGKNASLRPWIGETSEGFSGNSSVNDFETMLQLLYMYCEHPRFDKKIYDNMISRLSNQLVHMGNDNRSAMRDTLSLVSSNYNERTKLFNQDYIDNISFEKAQSIYKDRFSDASDFTFVFVGNFDLDTHLPLVKKYIGNLTSTNREEQFTDHKVGPAKGESKRIVEREMEVPKATINHALYSSIDYNPENRVYVNTIASLLSKRYLETIREEEGGTYGVRVRPSFRNYPSERVTITISFDCDPEKYERLMAIVTEEIEKLVEGEINLVNLNEIKEAKTKDLKTDLVENDYWMNLIYSSVQNDMPIISTEDYQKIIDEMDAKKIHKCAKKILKKCDVVEVIMIPKK
jgi:zinc protease